MSYGKKEYHTIVDKFRNKRVYQQRFQKTKYDVLMNTTVTTTDCYHDILIIY